MLSYSNNPLKHNMQKFLNGFSFILKDQLNHWEHQKLKETLIWVSAKVFQVLIFFYVCLIISFYATVWNYKLSKENW